MSIWNNEKLITSGDQYFALLLKDIEEAQVSIEIESYIFDNSPIAQLFVNKLLDAHKRKVRVHLLVDGFGSSGFETEYGERLKAAGVKYRIYHPLIYIWSLNSRNHRKVVVLDNRIAYVGSFNISADHSETLSGHKAWQDLALRTEGEAVQILQTGFWRAWNGAYRYAPQKLWEGLKLFHTRLKQERLFLQNYSFRQRQKTHKSILKRLASAQTRVWLMNPYFVPHPRWATAIKKAAKRGLDVRLYFSSRSDVPFMPYVISSFYDEMVSAGVKVYEVEKKFLHAKSWLIDKWACVGSSNLNSRSLFHDLEADAILQTEKSRHELELVFSDIQACSTLIVKAEQVSATRRWVGWILLLFRYWI